MPNVQSTSAASNLAAAQTPQATAAKSAKDSQDRFLTLLVTQLKNQDPLNPMDNAQVTSQLAQISTVEGIGKLNTTLEALVGSYTAMQSLQATGMLGHHVLVPGNSLSLANGSAVGGVVLNGPADHVVVSVSNASGQLLQQVDLGAQAAGVLPFQWDGSLSQGGTAANGAYTFSVTATQAGASVATSPLAYGAVTGVTPSPNGTTVTVGGLGTFAYNDVNQVLQ